MKQTYSPYRLTTKKALQNKHKLTDNRTSDPQPKRCQFFLDKILDNFPEWYLLDSYLVLLRDSVLFAGTNPETKNKNSSWSRVDVELKSCAFNPLHVEQTDGSGVTKTISFVLWTEQHPRKLNNRSEPIECKLGKISHPTFLGFVCTTALF